MKGLFALQVSLIHSLQEPSEWAFRVGTFLLLLQVVPEFALVLVERSVGLPLRLKRKVFFHPLVTEKEVLVTPI